MKDIRAVKCVECGCCDGTGSEGAKQLVCAACDGLGEYHETSTPTPAELAAWLAERPEIAAQTVELLYGLQGTPVPPVGGGR